MYLSRDRNGPHLPFQGQEWPKMASKAKNGQNEAGPGAAKLFIWNKGKTDRFWQLVGRGRHVAAQASKKWKEMIAQKAKMKGNEAIAAEIAKIFLQG